MKNSLKITVGLLFVAIFFLSFKSENYISTNSINFGNSEIDDTTFIKKYNKSYKKWQKQKARNGNSYVYKTSFSSMEGGFSHTTEITVENGVVVKREFQSEVIDFSTGKTEVREKWVEINDDLGSHQNGASELLTMDEIYKICKNDLLTVDAEQNYIYFETFKNGIVSNCGYFPKNCADDCFEGFNIVSFEWK